jgi:hypothetical protein
MPGEKEVSLKRRRQVTEFRRAIQCLKELRQIFPTALSDFKETPVATFKLSHKAASTDFIY